jgi:hypothetical protein
VNETCKLNGADRPAKLARTLISIASGHKQVNIADLMPWNYAADV